MTVDLDSGSQILPDQAQQHLVRHALRDESQQHVMIHTVERSVATP
ncbi:MAG: hypothetical protein ABI614_11395 [Planctomycetota bacterium]